MKVNLTIQFMGRITCLTVLMLALTVSAVAQRTITGTVTDEASASPLVGVSIAVKGTTVGTSTDIDGKYTISAAEGATLVFTYVGYMNQEMAIGAANTIDIAMKEDVIGINEVTVTALGIERQVKALGYAAQEIQGAELNEVRDPNLLNNLSGRVAGVNIVQGPTGAGSTSRITVRGETSLTKNDPLFVVDGVPISNSSYINPTNDGTQEIDYGNAAGEINPDDIESMSILKGAAATALYGSRAGNGVILITTKKGKSSQKGLGISYNHTSTFETILTIPEWQNDYGQGVNGQFEFGDGLGGGLGINDDEDQSWGPAFANNLSIAQFDGPATGPNGEALRGADVLARNGAAITPTAWQAYPDNVRDFFETGYTTTNNIAIYGGSDKGNFRLSYTNLYNSGIVPNNDLRRNYVSFNASQKVSDDFTVTATANYINTKSDHRLPNGYGSENLMYVFTWYGRSVNTANLEDYWQRGYEGVQQYNYNYAWHDNPYFGSYENTNALDKNRLFGNIVANYQITPELKLVARTGLDFFSEFRPMKRAFSTQRFPLGGYIETRTNFLERNSDVLLTYDKQVDEDIRLTISAGGNNMYQEQFFLGQSATRLAVPGVYSLNNSAVALDVNEFNQQRGINSVYALAQFAYKNYLYIDITGRNDWSSTLPENDNSYFYPSASVSWILSDMTDLGEDIAFAKLRVSWGQVGNDTDPYSLSNVFLSNGFYGSAPTATEQLTLNNANLKPELLTSFEVGADVRLFGGKVGLDLTYYNTKAENQIINLPLSSASGFNERVVNGGVIRSEGVEALVNLTPVKSGDFKWNTYFNFTLNRSKVEELPAGVDNYVTGFSRVYSNESRTVWAFAKEGERIGNLYGTGYLQVDGQDVYTIGSDGTPSPVKDPNFKLLGNYNPDFQLGWGNELTYKNLSLSFLFHWKEGGIFVSRTQAIASTSGNLITTAYRPDGGIVPAGVVEENGTYRPVTEAMNAVRYYKAYYDRDNEVHATFDATFVKLREVKLGYTFDIKSNVISELKLSLVGRNLLLFTPDQLRTVDPNTGQYERVTHFDPEVMAIQGSQFLPGVEDMAYPSTRSFGVNLSVKF